VGVDIPDNARIIRNLVMASQTIADHFIHFYVLHALDWVDVTSALQADPIKAAKIANNISPRPTTAGDLKAVQEKLTTYVNQGQLGIFTNAPFLGGHPAYYLPPLCVCRSRPPEPSPFSAARSRTPSSPSAAG